MWKSYFYKNYSTLIVLIVVSFLLLKNLGNQYLWQDEVQTCLISKTVLERGLPYGTDGVNFFSQELGAEYGENYIWKWHTWLPFYIQAFFFWLFGTSNFIARLSFALMGVGSVVYTYLLAKRLFNEKTAYISILLLITNVGFLVLSRQARLYSPSIMFSAASLYYFIVFKDEVKRATFKRQIFLACIFLISTTFLFHTHYFYYATFFLSIGIYLLVFDRNKIKQFVIPTIISAILNLPWIIWFRDLKYNEQYDFNFNKYVLWRFLKSYSFSTYKNISGEWVIIVLLIALVLIFILKKGVFKTQFIVNLKSISLLLIYGGISIIFLCFFTPVEHFRYLSTLYIPIILLISFGINIVYKFKKVIAGSILLLFIFANSFHRYIYEITNDYDGPLEGITNYINQHSKSDDIALVTYGDLPIKWYTGLKTYGGLTGEDLTSALQADWIIYRKHTVCDKDKKIKDFIDSNIDLSMYKKIEITYPDYKFENREDPQLRVFRPLEEDNIVIYKRGNGVIEKRKNVSVY